MIDLENEKPVALADVPKLGIIPSRRGGRRLNTATVYRWAQRGLRGVRLETLQCGGTKITTVPAIQRFFERLTSCGTPTPQTSKQKQKRFDAAKSELEAAGY